MHNGSQIATILQLQNRISTPKQKNNDFEARFKRNLKGKPSMAKSKNLLPEHHSHDSRCHYNAIYDSQLQNAIVLRMQLPQGATLTQPFHCDLQTLNCKTQAFVRGFLQLPRSEEMKTKLSCEASFKFQELKKSKQRFQARLLSNSTSCRYENEAFARGFLQISTVEDMKTTISCEASFNFQKWKMWKRSFRARLLEEMKTKLSCDASFKFQELKRWKRRFRARLPSTPKKLGDENETFVRCFLQIPRVEEMKTKLSCEASFKFQELKRWKRRFDARLPSTSKRSRSDRISSVQQFQCTEYLNTCKTQ